MLYTPSRVLTCGALLVFETESDIERYRPFARVTAANVDVERKSVSNDCRILLNFFKRSFVAAHLSHTNGGTKRVLKCPVFRDHERKRELPPSACCIFFFFPVSLPQTHKGVVSVQIVSCEGTMLEDVPITNIAFLRKYASLEQVRILH